MIATVMSALRARDDLGSLCRYISAREKYGFACISHDVTRVQSTSAQRDDVEWVGIYELLAWSAYSYYRYHGSRIRINAILILS